MIKAKTKSEWDYTPGRKIPIEEKAKAMEVARKMKEDCPEATYKDIKNYIVTKFDWVPSRTLVRKWCSEAPPEYEKRMEKTEAMKYAYKLHKEGFSYNDIAQRLTEDLGYEISSCAVSHWLSDSKYSGISSQIKQLAKEEYGTSIRKSREQVNVYEEMGELIKETKNRMIRLSQEEMDEGGKMKTKEFNILARLLLEQINSLADLRGETPSTKLDVVVQYSNFDKEKVEEFMREYILDEPEIIESEVIEVNDEGN